MNVTPPRRASVALAALVCWGVLATAAEAGGVTPPLGPPTELRAGGMRLSRVAISVRDIERSLRFYEALGFEASNPKSVRAATAKVLEVKGKFAAKLAYVQRDGIFIELVEVSQPPPRRSASVGAASQFGLSHLAIQVDDVERVAALIRASGGRVFDATRLADPDRDIMFCADPDGTRIELVRATAAGASLMAAPPRNPVK